MSCPVLKLDGAGAYRARQEAQEGWDHEALMARQVSECRSRWEKAGRPPEWDEDIVRGKGW
jgi:hypothetical protein